MEDQESPLSPTPTQEDAQQVLTGAEIISSFKMILETFQLQSASKSNKESQDTGKPFNNKRKRVCVE